MSKSLCLNLDEDEPVRQPFSAMPPPSGRAISHVWSYFECTDSRKSDDTWELAIGVHKILEPYVHATKNFFICLQTKRPLSNK